MRSKLPLNWWKSVFFGAPNTDGKALRKMWEGVPTKDLPTNYRRVNPVLYMKIQEDYSFHATYTVATSLQDPYICIVTILLNSSYPLPSGGPRVRSVNDSSLERDGSPKQSRLRTRRAPAGSHTRLHGDEDLMIGLGSRTTSWGASGTSFRKEVCTHPRNSFHGDAGVPIITMG